MKKIVIVGGGIAGLSSAYYLVKVGHRITVIDKGNLTGGASLINAGYVTPSHFISLAAPGMITKGIKWMFNSSSPFYIKPRWDVDFFKWAWNFRKSATWDKVESSVPVLKGISVKSMELYEEMYNRLDFKFHYENIGILNVYKTPKMEEVERKLAERAVKEGFDAIAITREELDKLQPGFQEDIRGAIHYKCDSHTTPGNFMPALKAWLEKNGVEFQLGQEVEKVKTHQSIIVAVETANNTFEADEFVFTTGTWTSGLMKDLGMKLPIQGGKGYSIDVHRDLGITLPAILMESKVAVTPMDGFVRFAGTMEFSGNNSVIRKNRVEAIANSAAEFYKHIKLSEEEKEGARSGLRPVSPDGLPYIGRTSKYPNLTVAAGHAMIGWSLGPATGKLVSQIVDNKRPGLDLSPFDPGRFG